MNNKFPKLNLEKFAHDEQSFYEAICHILIEAETYGVIKYILTDDINSLYVYSDMGRKRYRIFDFLKGTYLTGDKETLLSFLNEIIPNVIKFAKTPEWELDRVNRNLHFIIYKIIDIINSANNTNVFNVDFYYDTRGCEFKRKLDEVTTNSINLNGGSLDGDNKIRYEECVADFLSYKCNVSKNKLFYNESLDKLKKVIENTLQNNYKRSDGTFPKIHEKSNYQIYCLITMI